MRATVTALASAAAVLMLIGCAGNGDAPGKVPITTSSPKARKFYLQGRELQDNLRLSEAHDRYVKAVEVDPKFALGHLGVVQTALTSEELLRSIKQAGELADSVSPGEGHMIRVAEAYTNGRPEIARQHLEALAAAFPDDERVHFMVGAFHFGRSEWQEAIEAYRRALAIDPDFAPPYNQLGYALRNLGDFEGAAKAFKRYTELIPDEPNPYDSYAELLMKTGKFQDSIAQYEKALEVNPNFTASYVGIAHDWTFLGDFEKARGALARAMFIAPNDAERRQILLWVACSYAHEGNLEQALEEFERRVEIARRGQDLLTVANDLFLLGRVLAEYGRVEEAQAKYDDGLAAAESGWATPEVKDNFRRAHIAGLARIALARGDSETAAREAARYLEAVQRDQVPGQLRQAHQLLGLIALARSDWDGAIAELSRADPGDPYTLYQLARAYLGKGDRVQGLATLERAANFNGLSFSYAFVRRPALELLDELKQR
jgi:tetratricopeptide (TPR) repeat protein